MKLIATIKGYLVAAGAVFLAFIGYKYEKSKRKAAELDADTQRANVDLYEKRDKAVTDIDVKRGKATKKQQKEQMQRIKDLESLKHETDNAKLADIVTRLLNKDNKGR